jgi:hypothetical protein
MTPAALTKPVEFLEQYFSQMNLSINPGDERLNRFYRLETIPVEVVATVTPHLYHVLATVFGDALSLKIKFGGKVIYKQQGVIDQPELDVFIEGLKSGGLFGVLHVEFDLDKCCLAQRLLDSPVGVNATIIFHKDLLTRLFSESVVELEKRLKPSADARDAFCRDDASKQVILVPGMDVWVNGERLAIVGGRGAEQIDNALSPPIFGASGVNQIRKHSELNIKWIRLDPLLLTPLHLDVVIDKEITDPQAEDFLNRLAWMQFSLSLMYMSDSTRKNNQVLEVTFIGSGGSAQVNIPAVFPQYRVPAALQKGAAAWLEDCLWVYSNERQVIDGLTTVQSVVAQAFPGPDDGSRLENMLQNANTFHDFFREHWKIFKEGEIDKYFDTVKQISEFVVEATHSYGEKIDALIKSLTSAMLGAVVMVAGTFVGALLKDKFNPLFLIIGLIVYSSYLAIFPAGVGLTYAWQQFSVMKKQMNSQFEELKNRIRMVNDMKLDELRSQLSDSEARFKNWFGFALGAYFVIFMLSVAVVIYFLKHQF